MYYYGHSRVYFVIIRKRFSNYSEHIRIYSKNIRKQSNTREWP